MAGEDRCADLLQVVAGDATFTTRRADQIIHEHTGLYEMTPGEKLAHHKAKQREILDRFAGCEKRIFNDPDVRYSFRTHFNGVPGTMSNILTSGYFTLYDHLLSGPYGIVVNALDDYITMFHLASSLSVEDGVFIIDPEEFEAMKRIIQRLQSMLVDTRLFTEDWFRAYTDFLRNVHHEALESYTYYKSDPRHQTLEQALSWKVPRLPAAIREELANKYFVRSFTHNLYEYFPPYMNDTYYSAPMVQHLAKIPVLQQLFTHTRDATFVKPVGANKPSQTKTSKKKRRGGSRTLKRKGNKSSRRRAHSLQ